MQKTFDNFVGSSDFSESRCGLRNYIDEEANKDKERMEKVTHVSEELGEMQESCRLSVCIPAYKEAGIIGNTLRNYTLHQRTLKGKLLDPNLFEITILVNRPNEATERDMVMLEEIREFKTEHPQYQIRVAEITYDFPEKPIIGRIFKDIADAVILRNLARKLPERKKLRHIIRTAGADVESLNPLLIARTIDIFKNKSVMAHRGETRLPSELLRFFPLLHIMQSFAIFLLRQYHGAHTTNGPFSYTARAYASVGGFNPIKSMGEEIDLAERIWQKTKHSQGEGIFIQDGVKDVLNNPRRQVHAFLGLSTSMAARYNDFGKKINEDNVRDLSLSWRDIITETLPSNCILNSENLSREITEYYRTYIRIASLKGTPLKDINLLFEKGFRQFGIANYTISHNTEDSIIHIHDVDLLRRNMHGRTFSWMKNFPNYMPTLDVNQVTINTEMTKSD